LVLKYNRYSSKEKVGINPTFSFAIKISPGWTKSETGVNNMFEDLYEKIVDINNLKTFRLLEFFQNAA